MRRRICALLLLDIVAAQICRFSGTVYFYISVTIFLFPLLLFYVAVIFVFIFILLLFFFVLFSSNSSKNDCVSGID